MNDRTLDEAWADVERGLPEAWTFDALRRGGDGVWRAWADSNQWTKTNGKRMIGLEGAGDTPIAALRDLAYELRKLSSAVEQTR